ncbi:putative ABC-type nitrate/sulfonate/bicarbonate transport system, periplasmic component [Thiomonas sp. X19]|uniref:ABC transporter substrate-binding protein n=1 Tax=Thiomonas sp. X19 TaxID=1050370 RepID=UPI000B74433B|nr:ABC transporter substrate-binding protein [Thiomonas sp. X19]SCC91162.1 putative ABC-type nitrate/sulfonate/bicarbonate transport system, periplasmic component [Thiomonas sp. X19]
MPFVRRVALRTLASLAAFASLTVSGVQVAQATQPMNIGTVVWIGYGPFYVADAKGFFKHYGLDAKLQNFNDPALIPSAIASKAVEGGMLTYDQVIGSDAKGLHLQVVMPIDYSNGADAIVAKTDITKITQFKGQKIGYNPLSPSDFLLSYALLKNGMGEKDIQSVSMTPEQVPAAMASGGIPIGVTYEPSLSQIVAMEGGKKFHVVFSSKDAPGLITDVLVFNKAYIASHPKEVKATIQAYLEGLAYMKSHPDDADAIIGKAMGISAKDVKEQMSGVFNIPLPGMVKTFTKSAATTSLYGSGPVIGKVLMGKKQIASVPPIADTFDAKFVMQLAK